MIERLMLLAALVALSGCDEPTPAQKAERIINNPRIDVHVFHDDVRSATCYLYTRDRGAGISCLPDWMITNPQATNDPGSIPIYPNGEPCLNNKACVGLDKRRRALEETEVLP